MGSMGGSGLSSFVDNVQFIRHQRTLEVLVDGKELKHAEPAGTDANVQIDQDMYDACVVAAFGGIRANFKLHGKDKYMIVHPAFLFFFSIFLFAIQFGMLLFLKMETQLGSRVSPANDNEYNIPVPYSDPDIGWSVYGNPLLSMQLLQVVIVQAMLFKETIQTLRILLFVLNPSTWTEIARPTRRIKLGAEWFCFGELDVSFLFSTGGLFLWPIVAAMMKFFICYTVCVDSVSIILAGNSAKDAIFDSLVIMFVADLDCVCWTVAALIFHLDDFESFHFQAEKPETVRKRRDGILGLFGQDHWGSVHRGDQGRQLETMGAFTISLIFYTRQLAVILFALDTDVLPSARDVCTYVRWHNEGGHTFKYAAKILNAFMSHGLGLNDRLAALKEDCSQDHHIGRMEYSDMVEMLLKYKCALLGLVGASCFLLIPQVVNKVFGEKDIYDDDDDDETENKDEGEQVYDVKKGMRQLQDRLQKLERQFKISGESGDASGERNHQYRKVMNDDMIVGEIVEKVASDPREAPSRSSEADSYAPLLMSPVKEE